MLADVASNRCKLSDSLPNDTPGQIVIENMSILPNRKDKEIKNTPIEGQSIGYDEESVFSTDSTHEDSEYKELKLGSDVSDASTTSSSTPSSPGRMKKKKVLIRLGDVIGYYDDCAATVHGQAEDYATGLVIKTIH